jgi:phenylacetyl-CoA:acceptor oxidoreductase subunit 2
VRATTDPLTGSITYGTKPWHQASWDIRAAGNFIFGGAGSGLVAFAAGAETSGAALAAAVFAGLALVALGLLCVSLELGRPLRAVNVFRNPRTSWMSREAIAAALLMAAGATTVFFSPSFGVIAGVLALAFLYCQANIVGAARGIPAWRESLVVPLLVVTGMVEGAGIYVAVSTPTLLVMVAFAVLVVGRAVAWFAYRRRLAGAVAPDALAALDRTGSWMRYAGTLAPLAIVVLIAVGAAPPLLSIVAGVLAALTGSHLKYTLITRAGFNQGLALAHLPVRGARR